MTLKIAEYPGNVVCIQQTNELGRADLIINHDEQRELLEALARIHGFTLVDREERKSLQALIEEVDEPGGHSGAEWVGLAKGLAAATVSSALRFENDKEV